MWAFALLGCATPVTLDWDDDRDGLLSEESYGTDPANPDSDGDGHLDGEEVAKGADPLDRDDYPYFGGWAVDRDCRDDVVATGNAKGDVLENFEMPDQFGDRWKLHDFCNREIFVYATFFG